jgi:phage-related protein
MKIFLRVLLLGICIAARVFLFYEVSPFFSSIYAFFAGVYDFFVGAIEWIADFVQLAYQLIVDSFDRIKEFFVEILDFFEELPDIIEGFFSSFFSDIKGLIEMIDPTERLKSIGNSISDCGSDLKNFGSNVFDDVKDRIGNYIPDI